MLLSWMIHAAWVSALLSGAAWLLERGLSAGTLPRRALWGGTTAASVLLPLLVLLRKAGAAGDRSAAFGADVAMAPGTTVETVGGGGGVLDAFAALLMWLPAILGGLFDAVAAPLLMVPGPSASGVLWVWGVMSFGALGLILTSAHRLRSERRSWPVARIRGRRVHIAPRMGPAVVGVSDPVIVVPRWLLQAPHDVVELVLLHEEEHVEARDTVLLAAGLAVLIMMPWNLPLWWQVRRLRLAVEVDCDGRVLARGVSRTRYASLLLELGSRGGGVGLGAVALTGGSSDLERRMRILCGPARSRARAALAGMAGAVLLVVAACDTPADPGPEVAPPASLATPLTPDSPPADGPPEAPAPSGPPASENFRDVGWWLSGGADAPPPIIYVDGERLEVGEGGPLETLDPNSIERIEVIKAGASLALEGDNAAPGLINIFLKPGAARGGG